MKPILLAFLIFYTIFSEAFCGIKDDWQQFKLVYNKSYKNKAEERKRFNAFKNNMKEIKDHNRRFENGLTTFKKGITVFADLSKAQFNKKYKLERHGPMKRYRIFKNKRKIDRNLTVVYLDWRKRGAVTHVKDQGLCGSCWIFSGIGVLEGYNFRKTGELISLSEQNVVDCFSNTSCLGGFPGDTLTYVQENGVSTENEYPYRDKQMSCKPSTEKIKINFITYDYINGTEEDLRKALETYGPISVSMYVDARLRLYTEGIWYEKWCSDISNHAMLLIGYGTERGQDYWLIKNSWGTKWGEDGYLKVARNRHNNYCGLTNESIYII
ncbi:procathepsin L-like [Diorhabda carinulata]|uniref:procathepsin L-like n=1 Tax=Diorhabda carinulata TaxID=1163345 RepID=UPI0025A1225A|nr:procathepsin L-like [Diorhabda carinulata]